MQTQDFNPDPRPLPAGWTQHFEPTKQLWYYVQTNVTPPRVSFTHPIDMVPASRRGSPYPSMNNTQMPPPQLAVSSMQTPRNPSQSGNKLTFAQQLYASSLSSSLGPMVNSQSVPTSQLPPIHVRNLPTPPSSPPPGTGAHFPNASSNGSGTPPPFHQSPSHSTHHPSANVNSMPTTAPPFLNSHRMNTQISIPSNTSHPQRHSSSTYDPGTSQRSVVSPSVVGSRPTRHLVTMARPPDQQSSSALSPLVLEPPTTANSVPEVSSPPPASSTLFSQTTALTLPLTPPLTAVQSTSVTPPNISSLFSVPSGTAHKPQSISPFGKVAGVGTLSGGVISALQSVLLIPGTGVDQLSLQAVVQGRPDADYHRIINALIKLHHQQQQQFALMKLQMQQPPPPATDYKMLIAEVRKVQAHQIATAQQEQQQEQHYTLHSLQGQQQPLTAAQKYQALVQQQYQQQATAQQAAAQQAAAQQAAAQQAAAQQAAAQQAAAQQAAAQQAAAQQAAQQQQLQLQVFAQQQAAQYQAILQQQQQQTVAVAQQNQALLNNAPRPPHQQPQQQHGTLQSAIQPYLEAYKIFENLNLGGNTGGSQAQPLSDSNSLFSTGGGGGLFDNGGGGGGLFDSFSGGNFGSQDSSGGFDFLSVSFNQDNSGGFDMSFVDTSGQSN